MAGETDELQTVAEALFGVEQQGSSTERRAVPLRLDEIAVLQARHAAFPAPFVFGEAFLVLAVHQQRRGKIETHLGVIGFGREGAAVGGNGFVDHAQFLVGDAEIGMRGSEIRV